MLHSKLQSLSEKYKNIKQTYTMKQIQRQKERPAVFAKSPRTTFLTEHSGGCFCKNNIKLIAIT